MPLRLRRALSDPFLTRRITLAGRRLTISAPVGDAAFLRYRHGSGLRRYKRLCSFLLEADSVVLDVGANIGLTALVTAELVSAGRVLAVEGAPRNHAALLRNLDAHAKGLAEAVHCAVGASVGDPVHFVDDSAFGHVVSDGTMIASPSTLVPLTTIDALVTRHAFTRLDLIKLDIEGFEQDALEGARETLARFDPVVFLEFNVWCQIALYDRNPRRFLDWLLDHFAELHVWRGEKLVSVRELGPLEFLRTNMTDHRCNDDLIAVRSADRLDRLRNSTREGGWIGRLLARR